MLRNRRLGLAGSLLVVAFALTACGSGDDEPSDVTAADPTSETPTETTTAPAPTATPAEPGVPAGTPACADVWQGGAKLPRAYAGCESAGVLVERDMIECSSGQRIVRFDDAFYAVLGGPVQEAASTPLSEDPTYLDVMAGCRA